MHNLKTDFKQGKNGFLFTSLLPYFDSCINLLHQENKMTQLPNALIKLSDVDFAGRDKKTSQSLRLSSSSESEGVQVRRLCLGLSLF